MGSWSKQNEVSTLVVDESFTAQDDQFVDRVRGVTNSKYLAGLADRWKKDPRPWAREQIFKYLALPLDRPGHHPLVKRLFKQAEENRDTPLMAEFAVAFDRLIRRQRRTRWHYDWQTRQSWQDEELFAPRDQILATTAGRKARNPRTGERIYVPPAYPPRNGRLFSYRTRGYLRRRVARYFRRLGFQRPADYPAAVAQLLVQYQDADVARGENILDNWTLMHVGFRRSPVLQFKRTRVEVADGHGLGELVAAPAFEALWKKPESEPILLNLVSQAKCRLVRVWAIQLLKRDHAASLQQITPEQLLALLDHPDQEVQQFGANLLDTLSGIDSWPVSTWLTLLSTKSINVLATICQAMSQRVRPDRLTLEQCVDLACSRVTPVARLGLSWLRGRAVTGPQERIQVSRLAGAECEAIGADVAEYALSILATPADYRTDEVTPFFDSLNTEVRRGAWAWLTPESPGYDDASLWSRLLETPFDDVRLKLVEELHKRTCGMPIPSALHRQELALVWTTVLLGVHRGGRAKIKALRQISQAIVEQPDRAERLLPVLAVAIRSVRPPEARAGLSAILAAVTARPELEQSLAQWIPELRLLPAEVGP